MSATNKKEKAYLLLNEGKFDEAKALFNEILSDNISDSEIYIGRLLAELELCDKESLRDSSVDFSDHEDFRKALEVASEDEKQELIGIADELAEKKRLLSIYDSDFLENIYKRATSCEHTSESYRKNAGVLRSIGGYRDSSALAQKYEKLADELKIKEDAEAKERAEKEKAELEEKHRKSDSRQIKFYTVAIIILSLFLIFLICYNTFLADLIKKKGVLDEIYPLTYDDIVYVSEKDAPYFSINEDGELFFDNEKYSGNGDLVIPDVFDHTLVKAIANHAFARSDKLKTVVISDYVEVIGESAFENCTSLESVVLPSSVTQISSYAFHGCVSLKEISLPDSVIRVCKGAFSGCESVRSIVLPDSLQYIENYAFQNCRSLKTLTLGKSVKNIGVRAFSSCTSFDTIYYKGSEDDLEKAYIEIDNGPFDDLSNENVTIVYNYSEK